MIEPGLPRNEADHATLRVAIKFLDGRLAERGTIDWAIRLKDEDVMKRLAILRLLEGPEGRKLTEPWKTAWRLIEESWSTPPVERDLSGVPQPLVPGRAFVDFR